MADCPSELRLARAELLGADAGGQDACGPEGLGGGLHEACGTAEKVVGVVGDKRREVLRRRTAMVGRGAQDEMAAFMAADARLDLGLWVRRRE